MNRAEIEQHLAGAPSEGLDWLMEQLEQQEGSYKAQNDQLRCQLEQAGEKLRDYDPDWKQKARRQGMETRISAEIRRMGGRSERAIRALLDEDMLAAQQDPEQAVPKALEELQKSHSYLFEPPAPAAYSGAVGTAAPAANPDAALRAAFGLASD